MKTPAILDQLHADVEILRTGPDRFRLYDRRTGAHFEMGGRERLLVSLIERCATVDEVATAFEQRLGQSLPTREVREFLEQLRRQGLLASSPVAAARASDNIPHRAALLSVRGEPANVLFDLLTLFWGWMLHPIWLLLIVPGGLLWGLLVVANWNQVMAEIRQVCLDAPLVPLALASYAQTVLLLNLPLALVVGMCCRKYRGRIRGFGLTWGNWVLPTASFFTDIGDSIASMSPRGRRTQIAVGVLVPLTLGTIYTICWRAGSRSNDAHYFWAFMVIPAIIVTLWQCNPFSVQSSAHWALAAAVDDWKLHSRAIEETKAWLLLNTSPEPLSDRERFWLRTYGLAHYAVHLAADLVLLIGGSYLLTSYWGSVGAAVMAIFVVWWNRAYLTPLWRLTGMGSGDRWDWSRPARSR